MHTPATASPRGDEHSSAVLAVRAPDAPAKGAERERAGAMQKRRVRAREYRALALGASTLAAASALDQVRQKHELAAARWLALAALHNRAAGDDQEETAGAL